MLAAIQRQRPGDAEALSIAHHHFACTREMAAGLHARARVSSPFPLHYNKPAFANLPNAACSSALTQNLPAYGYLLCSAFTVYAECRPHGRLFFNCNLP